MRNRPSQGAALNRKGIRRNKDQSMASGLQPKNVRGKKGKMSVAQVMKYATMNGLSTSQAQARLRKAGKL